LRKLKRKATVDNAAQIPSATTVAPGMFKLDLEPLAPKLVHNREIHINYLKHTQEQADILRGIVEQAKAKQPLDNALDFAYTIPSATTVAPGMFKLDLEPLAPKLVHNREIHINYLKHTQEQADILQGIVEQAKAKQPLDNALDFACKHAKRIQELLVYVQDTCPSAIKLSETKVARTPMNKIKKVTFVEPIASSGTNQETHDSNKPMLHSTGVKYSTSASGSKPLGNTKNNRISQPSSSNKINKVEDQPRIIKTRNNKKNRVNKVKCNDVKDSVNDITSSCLVINV
nr:hypothetical protein [Tanacetum cinerariifolium]